MESYNRFSDYLKNKYGTKVYKIPVNLPVSCPNREDGQGGCVFCGEEGAGFELLSKEVDVKEQIFKNIEYIRGKYKAQKFIIYFQNYSNTYIKKEKLEKVLREILLLKDEYNIVGVYISTRPDCVSDDYLNMIKQILGDIEVVVELGLQTVNYKTLEKLKRGHDLAQFLDAVLRIKKFGFKVCAHVILDLPFDEEKDVVQTARVLSALNVEQVKCHSLYVLKGTELAKMYEEGTLSMLEMEDYVKRAISFLENLSPSIVVQRIIGRAPKERTCFCNFGVSWWKIHDKIICRMKEKGTFQGRLCDYLDGCAIKGI